MKKYSPNLIANAFLFLARKNGTPISHMKLQKLVFFAHAWSLALEGESMVNEHPEAWTYGPVFNSLYHELKQYGSSEISDFLFQMDPLSGTRKNLIPSRSDIKGWGILEQVWKRYGNFSALELSALTHEENGPWQKAKENSKGWISDDDIAKHYREKINRRRSGRNSNY